MSAPTVSPSDLTARLTAAQARAHGSVRQLTVPAGFAKAFIVARSQTIRIETPAGAQAAALFAFLAEDTAEWLSPPHTWARTRCLRPQVGDELLSTARRPLLLFLEDGADAAHDMLMPACDSASCERAEAEAGQRSADAAHRSCAGNLREALRELGVRCATVPAPVNFFATTEVKKDGSLVRLPANVSPGSHVVLEALTDLVCAVSSCPSGASLDGSSSVAWPTRLLVQVV